MKAEDETMPTKPVQDNYFSRGVKEKFEAAIRDKCRERLGRNNVVGIIEAAERCNTLHQQAMKEEREKDKENVKKILQSIRSAASILPELSICEFIDVILKDDI